MDDMWNKFAAAANKNLRFPIASETDGSLPRDLTITENLIVNSMGEVISVMKRGDDERAKRLLVDFAFRVAHFHLMRQTHQLLEQGKTNDLLEQILIELQIANQTKGSK